ncbi:GGDEF domain-containing protein [uncultured Nitratireductor sp.]|uniref:GGDEF domain-containing protein n=1 Tax=uncultured Nitratireductor sp. TaxID=520953 RepID=UPI0025E76AF3|nr:GGDEF domain-containing protein [uncultured Nitratireductor sp.]
MVNTSTASMTGLIGPTIMLVFAIGFVWVWLVDRRHSHSVILATACALFGFGMLSQVLEWPAGVGPNALFSGFLYTVSVLLTGEGILRRDGKRFNPGAGTVLLAAIMASLWYFSYVQPDLLGRIYVLNFSYGAILLFIALRIRPSKTAGMADRILFWVLLIFALHFFPRTLLTAGLSLPQQGAAPGGSLFWQTLQLSLSVLGAALALTALATILTDVMEELRKDRDRDGLTGVLNRRGFEEQAGCHVKTRRKGPLSLIVCDLDHFKQINDTYGHDIGDAALKAFGAMLQKSGRSSDIVGRIGGEEFALLLPHTDLHGARDLAERLRNGLSFNVLSINKIAIRLSASFGIVEKTPKTTSPHCSGAPIIIFTARSARAAIESRPIPRTIAVRALSKHRLPRRPTIEPPAPERIHERCLFPGLPTANMMYSTKSHTKRGALSIGVVTTQARTLLATISAVAMATIRPPGTIPAQKFDEVQKGRGDGGLHQEARLHRHQQSVLVRIAGAVLLGCADVIST